MTDAEKIKAAIQALSIFADPNNWWVMDYDDQGESPNGYLVWDTYKIGAVNDPQEYAKNVLDAIK